MINNISYWLGGFFTFPILFLIIAELTGHLHWYGQGATGLGRLLCLW